jgi:parallel beta-helix repeat protein
MYCELNESTVSNKLKITNNSIFNNGANGIYSIDEFSDIYTIISENAIYNNSQDGILAYNSFATISDNRIHDNYNGISITFRPTENLIENNQIYNNLNNGINTESGRPSIINNTIYSNDDYGIWINSDTADNNYILTNNVWGENQGRGINIGSGDNNIIKSNQLHHNEQYGICLYNNAQNNYIAGNLIYSNEVYGVIIDIDTADNNHVYCAFAYCICRFVGSGIGGYGAGCFCIYEKIGRYG